MPFTQDDLVSMQARLDANRRKKDRPRQKAADDVEREADLHEQIRAECLRRGWLALHGSMAHRAWRSPGEWDYVIIADYPLVLLIECKDKEGKVTKDQAALHAWAKKLGHGSYVVRNLEQFLESVAAENRRLGAYLVDTQRKKSIDT